jgi:hypothetical protein
MKYVNQNTTKSAALRPNITQRKNVKVHPITGHEGPEKE